MKRLLLIMLLSLITRCAQAAERILDFHSDITIRVDGTMEVVEAIKVRAEGGLIKRGIYRDFPTDYRDANGHRYRVDLDVTQVLRDGQPENYRTESLSNGVRIYIGRADHYLEPGEYTYAITYRTNRQLGFFADHDELYWNVTGNGWEFAIEKAGVTVHLPTGVEANRVTAEGYTGPTGAKGDHYCVEMLPQGAFFETTGALRIGEGLTIVVTWPKGLVHEPTGEERLGWLLRDNRDIASALIGLLIVTGFYLSVWRRVGRDPQSGVIIPQYDPPAGFSPGADPRRSGGTRQTRGTQAVHGGCRKGPALVQTPTEQDPGIVRAAISLRPGPGRGATLGRPIQRSIRRTGTETTDLYPRLVPR